MAMIDVKGTAAWFVTEWDNSHVYSTHITHPDDKDIQNHYTCTCIQVRG